MRTVITTVSKVIVQLCTEYVISLMSVYLPCMRTENYNYVPHPTCACNFWPFRGWRNPLAARQQISVDLRCFFLQSVE